jgi:hypothetical protein
MSDLKKAKEFLKARAIVCKKGNMALIKKHSEVIPIMDVIAVFEMLEENKIDEFIKKMEKLGYISIEQ